MKGRRTERAIEEIFAVLSNNAHNIWGTVGYGFAINEWGRVKTVMCGTTFREFVWPISAELVLCLHSIVQEGEEARRILEKVQVKSEQAQEVIPLKLTFGHAKLELLEEIYEEGSYWGDTRIEYVYRVTPMPSEDIVAYAVLIPHRTVIPVDTSQLWKVIYDVVTDEEDKPIRIF